MVDSVARYSVPIHVNQTSYKFEIFSLTIDREVTGNFFSVHLKSGQLYFK